VGTTFAIQNATVVAQMAFQIRESPASAISKTSLTACGERPFSASWALALQRQPQHIRKIRFGLFDGFTLRNRGGKLCGIRDGILLPTQKPALESRGRPLKRAATAGGGKRLRRNWLLNTDTFIDFMV
jgi:hypothetical protein